MAALQDDKTHMEISELLSEMRKINLEMQKMNLEMQKMQNQKMNAKTWAQYNKETIFYPFIFAFGLFVVIVVLVKLLSILSI